MSLEGVQKIPEVIQERRLSDEEIDAKLILQNLFIHHVAELDSLAGTHEEEHMEYEKWVPQHAVLFSEFLHTDAGYDLLRKFMPLNLSVDDVLPSDLAEEIDAEFAIFEKSKNKKSND